MATANFAMPDGSCHFWHDCGQFGPNLISRFQQGFTFIKGWGKGAMHEHRQRIGGCRVWPQAAKAWGLGRVQGLAQGSPGVLKMGTQKQQKKPLIVHMVRTYRSTQNNISTQTSPCDFDLEDEA